MDLGIAGKWALVCASSKGLGRGCAEALADDGVHLVLTARGDAALQQTADALRRKHLAIEVRTVVGDITTEAGRAAALAACPQVDILVTNAGGPPPGDFRDWEREDWLRALDANMLAPIALMRAVVDAMAARRFGRIVHITSAAVKAPIASLGLSNGARSGLTGFAAGLARQMAPHNVTINNLLPGAFDTDRLAQTLQAQADTNGQDLAAAKAARAAVVPAHRLGEAREFGAACAFLCSAQAGYITGQNLLIDGGAYPGTF